MTHSGPTSRSPSPAEILLEKLDRINKERDAVLAQLREAEDRKFKILGKAVLAEAEADAELKARLSDILARRVSGAQARADVAALIAG